MPGQQTAWRVGMARVKITPEEPIRMAGYGGREKPSEGVLSDLYAKAMAIEAAGSPPAILITADLVNFRAPTAEEICRRIEQETGLSRQRIILAPSHTHAGPVLGHEARTYALEGQQLAAVERYTGKLYEQLTDLAVRALADRRPAKLSWGSGKAGFVMNRRERSRGQIKLGVNREGYVDSRVPVLRIDAPDGRLRGLVFGCACHNTTLGGDNLKICGEYAGYAQEALEREYPDAQAMFMIGCGGDANPYPRGRVEMAQEHGRALAREVMRVAEGKLQAVGGPLRIAFGWADLPLAPIPPRQDLEKMACGPSYLQTNARRMLAMLEKGQELPRRYRAPLAVWQFGEDLTLLALPGEAVSGYVPLLEKALGPKRLWIAGYTNDGFGYLPTSKVLAEGGYETRGLIFDTGFFAPGVDDALVAAAVRLAREAGRKPTTAPPQGAITGELKKWHSLTITFDGPQTSETATPNPFRDYRLAVTFASAGKKYVVPGYFAADGNAANTGAASGNKWRVRFSPDATGTWTYTASFRTGTDVALSLDPDAGKPAAFDGASGTFEIGPSDKTGRDFRATGRLEYVGEHYLRLAESGRYFLKGGADSPENFLGYADFDGTVSKKKPGPRRKGEAPATSLHRYQPHVRDWRPGDPTWKGGLGKGIIGGLNYLAGKGVNSVYFLTMNVGGDGQDVWPWTSDQERFRFDCSKLDQWDIVFSHMDRLGIMLHVVTQEQENDQLLDGGDLGPERKLFYRELVARFGHHLAITWNLGEENTNTDQQRKEFSKYIHTLDPYRHLVVVHTFPKKYDEVYTPLLGYPYFDGVSLQTTDTRNQTSRWVERSAAAGRKWVVTLDEIGPANTGVKPDADDYWHDEVRVWHLWGNLMSGGAGVEWYFGYQYPNNDLNCEDWRSRDHLWDLTRYALDFFREHLPFERMRRADSLIAGPMNYCLAAPGEVYAIYLPQGGTTTLDLGRSASRFDVSWFNPRTGGKLLAGSVPTIAGPGRQAIGNPPSEPEKDWAVLVRLQTRP